MRYKCISQLFDSTTIQLYEENGVYDIKKEDVKRYEDMKVFDRFQPYVDIEQPKKKA